MYLAYSLQSFKDKALPYILIVLPFLLVFTLLKARHRIKRGFELNWAHEAALVLFVLYITGLASLTVIPELAVHNGKLVILDKISLANINFIPFKVFGYTYNTVNFIGNIAVFIPIGLVPPLLWKNFDSFGRIILTGFCSSLFIELCQLPISSRWSDVDDLWLNTLGALTGFILFRLIRAAAPESHKIFRNREG